MQRFAVLGRFLVTCSSGARALKVGLPLYFAIGIFATVIFAYSGLDATTVVARAEQSITARFILLVLWCVATLPVIRTMVSDETNVLLRSLPVPRWQLIFWLGVLTLIAELPWTVLWARGGGALSGMGAAMTALALHACVLARVQDVTDATLLAAISAAWVGLRPFDLGGAFITSLGRISLGAAAFTIALSRAWARAPELGAARRAKRLARTTPAALATSYGLVLVRGHGALLARAACIVAAGMGWTCLALRNEAAVGGDRSTLRFALSAWIPSCTLATATPLGAVLRAERAAEWVLVVCGTTMGQRRVATRGLAVVAGGTVGLIAATSLGAALGANFFLRFQLAVSLALTGALLSGLTEMCFRWAIRDEGRDSGRLVLAIAGLIACAETAVWMLPV